MSWFPGRNQESGNYINKQKRKQIDSLREQLPEYVKYCLLALAWVYFYVLFPPYRVVEIVRDEHYSVSTPTNGMTVTLNM